MKERQENTIYKMKYGSLEENNYNGNKKFFFTNHIGKIVSIGKFDGPWKYEVVYDEDIPFNHVNGKPPISWIFKESEIEYFSPDKNELEHIAMAYNYNL